MTATSPPRAASSSARVLPLGARDERVGGLLSLRERGLGCAYACVRWAIPVGIVFWMLLAAVLLA